MRIDATPSTQAHSRHASPGAAVEKTKPGAAASGPDTESPAAPAPTAGKTEKPDSETKLTPAGLLAAQLRFQSMNSEDMNKGQARAFEVISRNIERYQAHHGITPPTPDTDTTVETAPTTGTGAADGTGATSTPQPTAPTDPATGEADATSPEPAPAPA